MFDTSDKDKIIRIFVETLVETNRGFSFYVNWQNCMDYKMFDVELNAMNVLIKHQDIKSKFYELADRIPSFICTFPLLFALSRAEREKNWSGKAKLAIVNSSIGENDYQRFSFERIKFRNKLSSEEIDNYFSFFVNMGLYNLFENMLHKSVEDYVIGVLCGLDSNGRKNRGGTLFEDACEPIIKTICDKHSITYLTQRTFSSLETSGFKISDEIKNRKADFILVKDNKAMNIEVDYFFAGGSKPEEIVNSYINRKNMLLNCSIGFVLLTDGKCWNNEEKSQLKVAFDNIDIVNFYLSKNGMLEDIILKWFKS